jgi:cellulose synthase/poly-beta-1,6-N-acetylglucosamine synthase-like glycosyltransferase
MNTNRKTTIQASKPKMTTATLMRLAGLSAMLAGLCFIVMGVFHPVNVPSSVATSTWVNVHIFATFLGFFGIFGLTGLYARQVEESGWLGLAGFILFSIWFGLIMPFCFVEAFILPRLATESPAFVAGLLGMFTGMPSKVDLGILPMLWNISGPLYIFGPLLFGIATFRAGVLPRWAGALLVLGAVLVPVGAVVPPEYQPKIMIPAGLALAWLGYALFVERREKSPEARIDQAAIKSTAGKVA